jgi:uncharacterized protein
LGIRRHADDRISEEKRIKPDCAPESILSQDFINSRNPVRRAGRDRDRLAAGAHHAVFILAAACYARSSDRFHQWLINHRWLGEPIQNFQQDRGLRLKQKVLAIAVLWGGNGFSAYLCPIKWVDCVLLAVAIGVTIYLLSLKTLSERS